MFCDHNKRIGDNYGVSCQDCQAVLEGYGYGGFFGRHLTGQETCTHGAWFPISETAEECLYCHTTRERAQTANYQ
jgi:hypothetical protein